MFGGPTIQTQATLEIKRHKRYRLAALLGMLLGLLLVVLGAWLGLVLSQRREEISLPTLYQDEGLQPPKFNFAFSGISRPLGVAISPEGDRIYVTESDGPRETKIFNRDGKLLGTLNPPETDPASRTPVYVTVGNNGDIYVSDRRMGTIHRYSPDGGYLGRIDPPEGAGRWSPLALGVDSSGNLLVTDISPVRHRVMIVSPEGKLIAQYGRGEKEDVGFSYPNAIITDNSGRIIVADSNNGQLVMLDGELKSMVPVPPGIAESGLGMPRGLAIDGLNRLFTVDTVSQNVSVFSLDGTNTRLLFKFGTLGIENGQFNFPNGLALDGKGRLYITDRENNRVQVWTY